MKSESPEKSGTRAPRAVPCAVKQVRDSKRRAELNALVQELTDQQKEKVA